MSPQAPQGLEQTEPVTLEEFGRSVKKKWPADYKDYGDREVAEAMLKKFPEYRSIIKTVPKSRFDAFLDRTLDIYRRGTTLGPTIGGGIGGVVGGIAGAGAGGVGALPGAMAGASLGAAGGKAIEARLTGERPSPREAFEDIKSAALVAPLFEATGTGVSKLLGGAGPVSRAAMKRGVALLGKKWGEPWLTSFPGATDAMIDNAIRLSKGGRRRAEALMHQWSGRVKQILSAGDQAGVKIPVGMNPKTADLLEDLLLEEAGKTPKQAGVGVAHPPSLADLPLADQLLMRDVRQAISRRQPVMLDPSTADRVKRQLQAFSRSSMEKEAGRVLGSGRTLTKTDVTAAKTFQKDLNIDIDHYLSQAGIPGYKESNFSVQSFMGAGKAAGEAGRTQKIRWVHGGPVAAALTALASERLGYAPGWVGPAAGAGAAMGGASWLLNSPRMLSWLATATGNPEVRARILSQLARLTTAGAVRAMGPEEARPWSPPPEPEPAAAAAAPTPRQQGGPVAPGQPYLVGEQGPEVIVPAEGGTVVPNQDQGEEGDGDAQQIDAVLRALAQQGLPASLLAHPLFRRLVQALAPSRQKGRKKKKEEDQETAPSSAGPSGQEISPWVRSLIQMLAPERRQGGGPLIPGQAYLVGEQGPETIWPGDIRLQPDPRPVPSHESTQPRPKQPIPGPRFEGPRPPTWLETLAADPTVKQSLASSEILGLASPLAMMAGPAAQLAEAAARNPGLDMSEAARMARAAAQGKTLRAWRGTRSPRDYRELRPAVNPEHEFGIHAGSNLHTAEEFHNPGNPQSRILDLLVDPRGILETADVGAFKSPASWERKLAEQIAAWTPRAPGEPPPGALDPWFSSRYPQITSPEHLDHLQAILDLVARHTPRTDQWGYPMPGSQSFSQMYANNYRAFQEDLQRLLTSRGIGTIKYPNFVEGRGTPSYLFLDPRQARSIYAAFNPEKLGSAHLLDSILAAIGAGAAGAATGAASQPSQGQ